MSDIFEEIKAKFSDKIIIPVLGNHDSHPIGHYQFYDKNNFHINI